VIIEHYSPFGAVTVHQVEPGTTIIDQLTGEEYTVTDTCVVWRGRRDCYVTSKIYEIMKARPQSTATPPPPSSDE
jgi:hypothetical protein